MNENTKRNEGLIARRTKVEESQEELDQLLKNKAASKGLDAAKYNKRIREIKGIYR